MTPETPPTDQAVTMPSCPHCHRPLASVRWLKNDQAGIVTFYHDECMVVLNCQFIPVDPPRIVPPPLLHQKDGRSGFGAH